MFDHNVELLSYNTATNIGGSRVEGQYNFSNFSQENVERHDIPSYLVVGFHCSKCCFQELFALAMLKNI